MFLMLPTQERMPHYFVQHLLQLLLRFKAQDVHIDRQTPGFVREQKKRSAAFKNELQPRFFQTSDQFQGQHALFEIADISCLKCIRLLAKPILGKAGW